MLAEDGLNSGHAHTMRTGKKDTNNMPSMCGGEVMSGINLCLCCLVVLYSVCAYAWALVPCMAA